LGLYWIVVGSSADYLNEVINYPVSLKYGREVRFMSISESDWKKYKELRKLALDRFCQGVLAETRTVAQNGALSAHARYLTLYRLIRSRDKDMAMTFDGLSRKDAWLSLRLMVAHNLLTDAELSVLSDKVREIISDAVRQPYEIEWAEERVPDY
jgi:hypothetical protein